MKAENIPGAFAGKTVVCIASGPSLTEQDCNLVQWANLPTIVTNTTFRMVPWATILYGHDLNWWKEYARETGDFPGLKLTNRPAGPHYGAETLWGKWGFSSFHNSGADSIAIAAHGGAKQILLLGFDCQKTGGKVHWHGDHPLTLGNAKSMPVWYKKFEKVAEFARAKGVDVINCTRQTALTCFPRQSLEAAICAT